MMCHSNVQLTISGCRSSDRVVSTCFQTLKLHATSHVNIPKLNLLFVMRWIQPEKNLSLIYGKTLHSIYFVMSQVKGVIQSSFSQLKDHLSSTILLLFRYCWFTDCTANGISSVLKDTLIILGVIHLTHVIS